ncbi:hypothetical protein KAR91_06825 [Candidatus Pacearchaeota archaeon]|nr:hypothetical protein [Candidatus Pacearchaeota archaeon]
MQHTKNVILPNGEMREVSIVSFNLAFYADDVVQLEDGSWIRARDLQEHT